MLSFSYWYVILGVHLILPVNSYDLYSTHKIRKQRHDLLYVAIYITKYVAMHMQASYFYT